MSRVQLRAFRTPEQELAFYQGRYPGGYQHHVWGDHVERIAASAGFLAPWLSARHITTVADLSCGDGALIDTLPWPVEVRTRGDLVPAPHLDLHGPLPDSLELLAGGMTDLYLCSETLEHVPDPDGLLYTISQYAEYLFLSTPVDEPTHVNNPEHYWSWGTDDIRTMLTTTGWRPVDSEVFVPVATRHYADAYRFQFWFAERAV